jgi:hypothetical protein
MINIFKKGVKYLNSGVDTWIVQWTSRHGAFHDDTKQRFQAFTDKDEALEFANNIRKAHKLIGNTHGTMVTVTKQISGLSQGVDE